ncbi:hypothetical protein BD770DRAFT_397108 [Pilaira anomala]|nr:hypothetical protein BD770DRAFT_397108 [Pilaira anomala]
MSCASCIAQEGCGYCGSIAKCVGGGWFGALDKSMCGLNDYYYHQCHMSTLPLGIICIVLISIAVLGLLVGISIVCCCLCCKCCQDGDLDEDGEDRPLLGNKYLKRSATYYQWNRPPPPPSSSLATTVKPPVQQKDNSIIKQVTVLEDELPESSSISPEQNTKNWEDRRTALLKKYAREPSTN